MTAEPINTGEGRSLIVAVHWVEGVLLGTVGTSIAALAVALLGFAALTGRVDWRRGLQVVLGCFILFGAPVIAGELMALVRGSGAEATDPAVTAAFTPPARLPPVDPYAGASVPLDKNVRE